MVNGRTAGRVFPFPRSPATHHLTVGKARGESTHALAASRAPVTAPTPFFQPQSRKQVSCRKFPEGFTAVGFTRATVIM